HRLAVAKFKDYILRNLNGVKSVRGLLILYRIKKNQAKLYDKFNYYLSP
ncbi:hypothetical protein HMPREF9225_0397, partial [Peptoniphilus duerdenii ATCC BAA-1640]